MIFCIAGCENILERVLMVIVVELYLLRMQISVENVSLVICYALKAADTLSHSSYRRNELNRTHTCLCK